MSSFFAPPPSPWPEQAAPRNAPPWTGRPQGETPAAAVGELRLARSARAEIRVAYIDAYPEGFELEVTARTDIAYDELRREGDRLGPDVFGGHWPLSGERRDVLPPQLLRVGVRFADGRVATNIGGHDRPLAGPTISSLRGGGTGRPGESHFHQGYWVSPLPPPGPVELVCEWPAAGIPVTRREVDSRALREAAERSRAMFGDGREVHRDGHAWRVGTGDDVAWINAGTAAGLAITSAVPPVFEAYCTLEVPPAHSAELARHEQAVIARLAAQAPEQPWWLGYLDTGASDVVFPYAPRTVAYYGYGYVLVEAGPRQAAAWRSEPFTWTLPELIFPADRSWLVSTMWDDGWSSIGGSRELIERLLGDPVLGPAARRVDATQDATPPGQQAR